MSKAVQPVQPSASPAIGPGPCMLLQLILGGKFQPLRSGKCRPKGLAHHITAHWKKTPFKNKNMVRIVKFDLVIMVSLCVLFFHSFLLLSNCRIVRRACMLSRTSLQNQFSFFFFLLVHLYTAWRQTLHWCKSCSWWELCSFISNKHPVSSISR